MVVPIGLTAGYSFFRWDGLGPFEAVGLLNYRRAIQDSIFRSSFVHAAIYIGLTIVLEVFVGMALAGLLTARPKRGTLFRVAFFVPVMLPMVVIAVLWAFVYNPDIGLLNASLRGVGLDSLARVWLGDPDTALVAISVVSGWVFAGFYMAIFYAAFQQIPATVLEAAQLDGAGGVPIFWHVKVPMVRHAVEVGPAAVHHGRAAELRPVLRTDQRWPVQLDGDPDDVPRQGRLPQPGGGLRVGVGGDPHRGRARDRRALRRLRSPHPRLA